MNRFYATAAFLIFCLVVMPVMASAQGDTLTVAIYTTVKTMDPQTTTNGTIYGVTINNSECLVAVEKGKIVPLLAESWKLLDDQVTYVFTLKQGVKFHNGETMTADDVVYSLKRGQGPMAGAVRAQSMYMAEAKKIDDRTVSVKAVSPMGETFLGLLSHPWATIYNQKYTEAAGLDYGQKPVGTGKYKLKRLAVDRIELERFDDYHGAKAKIKNLIFRTIIEATSRTIELESGALDSAHEVAGVDIDRINDNPNLEVEIVKQTTRGYHIGFDVTLPPWDNLKLREAINIAINRHGVNKVVFYGHAEASRGPFPSGDFFSPYKDRPDFPYDPAAAKKLLAEAGYPNGLTMSLIVAERSDYQGAATVVQSNLRDIGIDMKINLVESGMLNDVITRPKHDPFLYGWGGNVPTADPFFFLNPLYHSKAIGQTNRYWYNNPELDKLLDDGVQTMDPQKRAEIYNKVWDILNRDLPSVPIYAPYILYGKTKNLKGVDYSPTAANYYGNAYFE